MWRLGIVDLDSSHCVEFSRRLNHVGLDRDQYVEGARVVAACSTGSVMSPERIAGHRAELEAIGIPIVAQPQDMLGQIDAVLILSICGTAHLERVRPFLAAGIPAFVDKPFACALSDAIEMVQFAEQHRVLLMSSSGMRFADETLRFQQQSTPFGNLLGAVTFGPAKRADGNPGLFHYGIHSVELLLQLMGSGCESVRTTFTDGAEVVTGQWADGRLGTGRGNRGGSTAYGYVAFGERGVLPQLVSTRYSYRNLLQAFVQSLNSGQPAVPPSSSVEVVRFILAALRSEQSAGRSVRLDEV